MVSPGPSARMPAPFRSGTLAPMNSTFSMVMLLPAVTQMALPLGML